MGEVRFTLSLLDDMFPGDSEKEWKKFSEWVDVSRVRALPYAAELEATLRLSYSDPDRISYETLQTDLIDKSKFREFCKFAISYYFSNL